MTQDAGSAQPMAERMQSLLTRAVEDQLSEQRQLAAVLGDIRAQLERLGDQVERGPGGTRADDEAATAEMAERLDRFQDAIAGTERSLTERLESVGRLVQQRGADLSELKAAVDDARTAIDEHAEALAGLTSGLSALPAFGDRIDALQRNLSGLHDRARGIEEVAAAVAAIDRRATNMDATVRELRQAVAAVNARLGQLADRPSVESVSTRVSASVDAATSRLVRIESTFPSMFERLEGIEAAIARQRAGYEALAERLEEVAGAGGEDAVAQIGRGVADLRAQLDSLQGRVASGADLEVVAGRLDEVFDALFGDDGIQAQLSEALESDVDEQADRTAAAVTAAVAASEARLRAHVDEAILALADVLLRRKPRRRPAPVGWPEGFPMANAVADSMAAVVSDRPSAPVPVDEDLLEDIDELEDEDVEDEDPASEAAAGDDGWEDEAAEADVVEAEEDAEVEEYDETEDAAADYDEAAEADVENDELDEVDAADIEDDEDDDGGDGAAGEDDAPVGDAAGALAAALRGPWQTPPPLPTSDQPADEGGRKSRPWWKPSA